MTVFAGVFAGVFADIHRVPIISFTDVSLPQTNSCFQKMIVSNLWRLLREKEEEEKRRKNSF